MRVTARESVSRQKVAQQRVQPGRPTEGQKRKRAEVKRAAVEEGSAEAQHPPVADPPAATEWSGNRKEYPRLERTAVLSPEHRARAEHPPHLTGVAATTDGDRGIGPPLGSPPLPTGRALLLPRHSTPHRAADCHVHPCEQTDLPEGSLHNACNRGATPLVQSWSIHVMTWSLFLNEGKGIQPLKGYNLSTRHPFQVNARKSGTCWIRAGTRPPPPA